MWAMHGEERESLGTCVAGLYLVVSVCVYDCVCMCIGNAQSEVGELGHLFFWLVPTRDEWVCCVLCVYVHRECTKQSRRAECVPIDECVPSDECVLVFACSCACACGNARSQVRARAPVLLACS